jgi:hypothetical protein
MAEVDDAEAALAEAAASDRRHLQQAVPGKPKPSRWRV